MELSWETPEEIDLALAHRVRDLRKRKRWSGEKLSAMSGVSYGTLKRFEQTGQISLLSLTKLAAALDCTGEIKALFSQVAYKNIEEVINENR